MTTKEQERKALAQIEKILASLEEDSYVRTAMQGMVEDAKSNIENDFADSYYDRYNSLYCQYERLEGEVESLRDLKQEQSEIIAELRQRAEKAEDNMLTRFQIGELKGVVEDSRYDNFSETEQTAKKIVAYADDPNSREFKDAVAMNRRAAAQLKKLENLWQLLDKKAEAAVK